MDVCGGESLFLRLAVAMLLSVALVKETDANWGECPGGCCDCIPIPPCPDLSCIEPLPLPPPDTVPPKLHGCPQHIPPRSISSGRDTVSVCWKEPWASDNRGPSYFKPLRQGPQPCSEFREGTHIISYTATDLAGNKAECQFRIVIHAIVCNQLNAPPNTRMQCSLGNRQGSVCTYYCNANYYLVSGSKQRDCGAGGRWSGTEANCQIRRCDILMPPVNGDLRCRGGDIPGSTCTYTCNVGYYLESGTETRRCRADGHWTGSEARCRAIRCSQLSAPPHGYLSCSGLNPGSTCHYRCDVGYYITVGSTTRTCNTNGDWTGANGICERKVEPCPHLPSPSNGHISCYGDNNPGSWCQYHCNAGYTLHGPASRVCSNDGRWTGSDSQCQLRSCATLSPPVNGLITCTAGNAVGSRCQYSCNDGLRLVRGSAQRTCQESGSWSGTEAVCEEISCPELSSPRNGYVRCNGYTYGSRCDYECQSGYSVGSGSSSRTCQNNGRWSGREVLCTRVECHDLPNPRNGYVQCQGDSGRRRCTYYCNTGYVIESGSQYRDCNNGQWSGREVFCRSVSCRPLNNPRHGNVNCQGNNEPGTRCTYRCNDSAQQACRLAGSSVRECGRDGEWSGTEPVCHCEANRECPRLHAPPNAVIMCFPDDPIEEGTYCDYVCNAGYQHVSGPRRTVCLGRAGWTTEEQAVCRANPCPRLPRIPNGDIDCSREDKYLVSTRCDYRCHSGYTLTPDAVTTVRVCRADGTWSGVQGRCENNPVTGGTCSRLRRPSNGELECDYNDNRVGTMCVYTCDAGYILSPRSHGTRVCRHNLRWSLTEPVCERESQSCPALRDPPHGSVRCTGYNDRDQCEYTCDQGYTLTGARVRTCNGERWGGTEAVCSGQRCDPLPKPLNGEVVCSGDYNYGAKCEYYCKIGFVVTGGAYTRYCDRDGSWTGRAATCSVIQVTCKTQYSCRRQCPYRSCSGSYTRLKRAIDTIKYRPKP